MAQIFEVERYREKTRIFRDRKHAGLLLAEELSNYKNDPSSIIVAIPAGGVPVGYTISEKLELPLEVAITRKLHVPWNQEAGFGAVTWNELVEINEPLVNHLGLTEDQMENVIEKEIRTINNRRKMYGEKKFPDLEEKHPILVDDGIASGFSMLTTAKAIRKYDPMSITVAVPTAPKRSIERIQQYV
ncbi:phosphoribosyltransferase, partial [Candidatus Bathyarchaeota archaeon]|nr:phosphoribosyltransferase [Candidatus Bathyarchaeota archaeon]